MEIAETGFVDLICIFENKMLGQTKKKKYVILTRKTFELHLY